MQSTRVVGVIPARYGSTRLPGKPLKLIGGVSLIERVYLRAREAAVLDDLLVATDDVRIHEAVRAFGGTSVITSPSHPSGTDRLAEAMANIRADIVVNIQGDQPFIDPVMIEEVVLPLTGDTTLPMATLMYPIQREEDLHDAGVVKVVTDLAGHALYFSRSLLPYPRTNRPHRVYEHVGLYAYRRDFLFKLASLSPTPLEEVESLEQLRVLEHGYRIRVVETRSRDHAFAGFSIDTQDDLERAESMLRERAPAV